MRTILVAGVALLLAVGAYAQKAVPRGSKATGGGVTMIVHGHMKAHDLGYSKAKLHNIYVIVDVTFEGVAPTYSLWTWHLKLRDSTGALYGGTYATVDNPLDSGTIAKGQKVRGKVVFEIPDAARGLELIHTEAFIASRI